MSGMATFALIGKLNIAMSQTRNVGSTERILLEMIILSRPPVGKIRRRIPRSIKVGILSSNVLVQPCNLADCRAHSRFWSALRQ